MICWKKVVLVVLQIMPDMLLITSISSYHLDQLWIFFWMLNLDNSRVLLFFRRVPKNWRPWGAPKYFSVVCTCTEISLFGRSGKFATCHSRVHFVLRNAIRVHIHACDLANKSYSQLRGHAIGVRPPLLISAAWKCFHNAHVYQSFWSGSTKSQPASHLDDLITF
jgi:hypothetical protein